MRQELWQTARIHVAHVFQEPTWKLMGAFCGFASGDPGRTHRLLEFVSSGVVCEASGPRCFGGHFNLTPEQLLLWDAWKTMGFVELQDLWAARTGQPPVATRKGKTRKDHLFLTWELAQMVQSVEVRADYFSDHAVLIAHLQCPHASIPRPVWRK